MHSLLFALTLIAQVAADKPAAATDPLRDAYREAADKYAFERKANGQRLERVEQPIMRWANDDDWSGDVFVWTHADRPEVVGCVLAGPRRNSQRLSYHEFHLLATEPIAPVDLQTKRRWAPQMGLTPMPVNGAPPPASSSAGRLTQMRKLAKDFTAHMEAAGAWELRLLPQPLYRWGKGNEGTSDGALFGYVWPKGTDLELILLLEARPGADGLAWHYAPVRFSNRKLWLTYEGEEVWRVDSHREPPGSATDLLYTTAYAGTIADQPPAVAEDK